MEKKYKTLNKLKGKIAEQGESYRSLHEKTGISSSCISNKINGYYLFDVGEVEKLCNVLHISAEQIAYFFGINIA